MECLQIDWENIDGTFEKDDFYENIQAPKWIDFSVPLHPIDDHAWFCGKSGCTHPTKSVLQALNKKSVAPFQPPATSVNATDLSGTKTTSAGVATKKAARALVSSSLSSLADIKAGRVKSKVLHQMQMPSIGESKASNNRWQQASENENPNRVCKVEDGVYKKPVLKAVEGIAKHMKMSESKVWAGKEAGVRALPTQDASPRLIRKGGPTLSEQVLNLSHDGPLSEPSKSVFVFGKGDTKSSLIKDLAKEPTTSGLSSTTATGKKAGGVRPFSRMPPSARNPYLSASLSMPVVRRSAAIARPLHGVYLGNEKAGECKPPRAIGDVRVSVQAHGWRKRNDQKMEAEERKAQARGPQKATEVPEGHINPLLPIKKDEFETPSLPATNDELDTGNSIAMAYTEDAITNTLEKFLENLQISSDKDESGSTDKLHESEQKLASGNNVTGQNMYVELNTKESDVVAACDDECTIDQDAIQSHHMGDGILLPKDNVSEHGTRCSHDGHEISHTSEPLHPNEENHPASMEGLHVSSCEKGVGKDALVSKENGKGLKKLQQKQEQDAQFAKECKRHIGTKRKSSELNLNCVGKDRKHITQKSKKSWSIAKLATVPASQPYCRQGPCEEHNKRMKTTTTQAFKPFRLRTEERGALKELGLAKKDSGNPNTTETVHNNAMHHALRMPSFVRPFRPQRSTKKLTIPKEPKFHVSRMKTKSSNLDVNIGSQSA